MTLNIYQSCLLPYLIDWACGLPSIQRERKRLVPQARGEVLEVGIGTGRNLPFYDLGRVALVSGIDPVLGNVRRLALERARLAGVTLELLPVSAESIPAASARFDTVITTFTLCSIPDVAAALSEMRRVLKPEGQLLFVEHGAAPDPGVRRWQDRLTPFWKPVAGGCHLNRDMPALLREAGFSITALDARYLRGPRPLAYIFTGSATRA